MPDKLHKTDKLYVKAQSQCFDVPFTLASGKVLPRLELAYECYGELNADKSNAVLVCHALTSSHHAAGWYSDDDKRPGWWDHYIGPDKAINTNQFFVVCINNIGSCYGSTGPLTINPESGKPYGASFPSIRVRDWVHSQKLMMEFLGIEQWAAIVGGSLGGMQVMRWALEYPNAMRYCLVIASSMKLTAQNIAFNEIARNAIRKDPDFRNGDYAEQGVTPSNGLAMARMVGHLTYLSDDAMDTKFGRELRSGSFELGQDSELEFQVESYLRYQGSQFADGFDANTYILLTRVLDFFDLAREYGNDPVEAFKNVKADFLVVSFSSDWRFSPERSQEISNALLTANKNVSYANIESKAGHDAFLLPNDRFEAIFSAYMKRVEVSC